MLRPRIIPSLLIHKNGLVKTINFKDPKYIGDPINVVRIFNEKEVDELMVFDIDASVNQNEPNYKTIKNIASECRMPLCYGGGIKNVEQAKKIFSLGVEKVSISSAAISNPNLIKEIVKKVGSQSMVVVLDVKKFDNNSYHIWINNGKKNTEISLIPFLKKIQDLGVGEIVINSIDNDGVMDGYDLNLIDNVYSNISIPLTILGGAGTLDDIKNIIKKYKIIGLGVGSLFVFKGVYKAVLVNYPNYEIKNGLIKQ